MSQKNKTFSSFDFRNSFNFIPLFFQIDSPIKLIYHIKSKNSIGKDFKQKL